MNYPLIKLGKRYDEPRRRGNRAEEREGREACRRSPSDVSVQRLSLGILEQPAPMKLKNSSLVSRMTVFLYLSYPDLWENCPH